MNGVVRLINLTPHPVRIGAHSFPASGRPARVGFRSIVVGSLNGIVVVENVYGEVEDLPEWRFGTAYIVSRMVAEAAPRRGDLFIPDVLIRDAKGVVVGAERLARVPRPRAEAGIPEDYWSVPGQ